MAVSMVISSVERAADREAASAALPNGPPNDSVSKFSIAIFKAASVVNSGLGSFSVILTPHQIYRRRSVCLHQCHIDPDLGEQIIGNIVIRRPID